MVSDQRHPLAGLRGAEWVAVCADLLHADGATAVLTSAHAPDSRRVLYPTAHDAVQLADLQYLLGEGPHAETMADGRMHSVSVDSAADRARWPLLVDCLIESGVRWVRTVALGTASRVGTLQCHGRGPLGTPDERTVAAVGRLADVLGDELVTSGLAGVPADPGGECDLIDEAIGVLAGRHRIDAPAASAVLRAAAFAADRTVALQARAVLGV